MDKRIFRSDKAYTEEEISKSASPVNHDESSGMLIADTPEREYWFRREGHYWRLDHTWGHFFLVGK